MSSSQTVSGEELVRLLQEEKVKEFNELRPKCIGEDSDRRVDDFAVAAQDDSKFASWLQELGPMPASLYLPGTEFANLNLEGVNFSSVQFAEADFSGSNLTDANFANADCTLVNFANAKMDGADIMGTNFFQANFSSVDLSKVNQLGYAIFAEAEGISPEQREHIIAALRRTWR